MRVALVVDVSHSWRQRARSDQPHLAGLAVGGRLDQLPVAHHRLALGLATNGRGRTVIVRLALLGAFTHVPPGCKTEFRALIEILRSGTSSPSCAATNFRSLRASWINPHSFFCGLRRQVQRRARRDILPKADRAKGSSFDLLKSGYARAAADGTSPAGHARATSRRRRTRTAQPRADDSG